MNIFDKIFWLAVMAGAIRSAVPLLLAGLGELIYQRGGVMNLGIEGLMLLGAWTAVSAELHGVPWHFSLLLGMTAGSLGGLLHWFLSVKRGLNQPVTGLALLFFFQGTTAVWGRNQVGQTVNGIPSEMPMLGTLFNGVDPVVLLSPVLVIVAWYFLFRTRQGIMLRACGESASSAMSSGVNVARFRAWAAVVAGSLAGLAGGHFAIAYAQQWQENMLAGRGWIALVLVIFSGWNPYRLLFGALLFGGLTALQINLQIRGWTASRYLLGMLPFVITIIVLIIASWREKSGRGQAPADLGNPMPE